MSLYLAAAIFGKRYRGVYRAVVKNSSTPEYKKNKTKITKLANRIRKQLPTKTGGSQPNSMENYFKSFVQNTK